MLPALFLALLAAAPRQEPDHEAHAAEHARKLDAVVVAADPLRGAYGELIQPASVLQGQELEARKAATLGESLAGLPGVQQTQFGAGASRPVIRGQEGARVQVLSEGIASMDASTLSVDHATTIEPFLADQIEVLRGPATLLYGAGAVGGVVNVIDGRIAEEAAAAPLSGRAQFGVDSVADSRFGMARIEAGNARFVLRADGYHRDADDYEIPGHAERAEGEHADEGDGGLVENSAVLTRGGALGASLIGESGFIGVAVSGHRSRYGIPGHAHAEEGAAKEGEEEEAVVLDLDQARVDLKAGIDQPFPGAESLRVRLGHNDYEHVELEGAEIGTRFRNRETSGRVDLVHADLGGWRGAIGLSASGRDFAAVGEEAFVPPSDSRQWGLFVVERRSFGDLTVELGARHDRQHITPAGGLEDGDHHGTSLSAGAGWAFADGYSLHVGLDRAARLPTAEELYSDGPHAATGAYEIGDADLDPEFATQAEIGLKLRGERFNASFDLYSARLDDFIYLADTGSEADGLPVRQWTQADARFSGFEAEGSWHLAETAIGHFDLRGFGDRVRARLARGGDLPRIPQSRLGAELRWHHQAWQASLGATRYFEQERVAEYETPSGGFTLWNAHVGYAFEAGASSVELYLKGENLGDEEARLHTSALKDRAPLPGRNVSGGVRVYF